MLCAILDSMARAILERETREQVASRCARHMSERAEWPFLVVDMRTRSAARLDNRVGGVRKPLAAIADGRNGAARVRLPAVVNHHDIGIRDDGRAVRVLNLDGLAWKHEEMAACRSRIAEVRITRPAAKRADSNRLALVDDSRRHER
jgi:hypothetical protein